MAMRKILFLLSFMMPAAMSAQGDVEYMMEAGGGLGLVTYLGDYNSGLLKDVQPMASLMLRRHINLYHGFRLRQGYGKLKGSSKNEETYYPGTAETPYEFNNSMVDLCATYEYNFWPYGTGLEYRGAQRLTPFIFLGLGMVYTKSDRNVVTASLPLGIGVKYKLADRLNLGVEWSVNFSMNDRLDGSADPYSITSSGIFKNTDCYSALQVSLTYSFMAKCRTCHNEDE